MKLENLHWVLLIMALLISACAETSRSVINNSTGKAKVTLLYKGHVEAIEGKTFLPWSTHDGASSLSTSVFVIQSGGKVLMSDPGEVRKG